MGHAGREHHLGFNPERHAAAPCAPDDPPAAAVEPRRSGQLEAGTGGHGSEVDGPPELSRQSMGAATACSRGRARFAGGVRSGPVHAALRAFAGLAHRGTGDFGAAVADEPSWPPVRDTPPGLSDISDGRSPDLRVYAFPNLPGLWNPVVFSETLAAHSCGGSHGFGACWLHLTVFPFHPASPSRANGNHHRKGMARFSPRRQCPITCRGHRRQVILEERVCLQSGGSGFSA